MNKPFKLILALLLLFVILLPVLACGSKSSPSPTPSLTPSFEQQRVEVVKFLTQFNQANNNAEDTMNSADIQGKLSSGNLLDVNSAINTLLSQIEGYGRQISEMTPPSDFPELAELKSNEQQTVTKFEQSLNQLRSAIQTGNQSEVQQAVLQLSQLESDTQVNRSKEIEETILAKFNIPDAEVYYRYR